VKEHPPQLTSRGILAATIGNMLEFCWSRFLSVAQSIQQLDALSLATFGAGFITRPIGAVFIGAYSDRAGRRPAMILSFAMMGSAIIALALTPSYDAIGVAAPVLAVVARLVQGFSLGGEVGPTTAYLMEAASPGKRGVTVSWQPASQQIAATTGALVGLVLSELMTGDALNAYGWRVAFLIGAITLPVGLWLRRELPETLHLHETCSVVAQISSNRLDSVRGNTRVMILGLLILASGTIITYVTQYMTTYAENTLHVATDLAFATALISNSVGVVAALFSGWLADRFGRWPVMVWPQLTALLLTYPIFLWIVHTRGTLALGGLGLLSLVGSVPYSGFYVSFAESLPKNIRGVSFATIYAIAIASFGGTG
jgi:MFS transporter, MHS family, citrate/tricarballylate:H+ symporter